MIEPTTRRSRVRPASAASAHAGPAIGTDDRQRRAVVDDVVVVAAVEHLAVVDVQVGRALDILPALDGQRFDAMFLDADKERYPDYYAELLPRVRQGGLIVADNTLWSGHVLSPRPGVETDRALVAYTRLVTEDPRVENVLLTVRDGIMLARKR